MSYFNEELIKNVKLLKSNEDELLEEKYCFIQYVFSNLESISKDDIDLCEESFEEINCNIDGYYYDEDAYIYNLYIAIYDDKISGNTPLAKYIFDKYYDQIVNFVRFAISGKYIKLGESSFTYTIAKEIHDKIKDIELTINIVSNYRIEPNLKKDNIEKIENINVSFRTYDLDDLKIKFNQLINDNCILDCNKEFNTELKALKIINSIDFDVYLFSMKGTWLANLYKNDSVRLLEQNVRSYLKRTAKVNAGILSTVKNNPEQFVSFNNGISAVSTNVESNINGGIYNIKSIANFQIVNGGQTTATLYECLKDRLEQELENVNVPIKLTVVKNIGISDDFIRNISIFSNTQTAIKKSDPPSNLPFYIKIKKISQECLSNNQNLNYLCYFERTNGEYNTEFRRNNASKKFTNIYPKNMKFDKIDLARAINCWEQLPYITCNGREKNFTYFNDVIKNQINLPDTYYFKCAYSTIIIYRKLDTIAKKMKLSFKSNVVAYTLSLISHIYDKYLDLEQIWVNKDLTNELKELAFELLPKVHNVIFNAPNEYPESRMWARKEKCWEQVKKIEFSSYIEKSKEKVEFFMKNEALNYISLPDNFNNQITWMKLLLWDNKMHSLTKQEKNIVKLARNSNDTSLLSNKQKEFLKDIFIGAVKKGYDYH